MAGISEAINSIMAKVATGTIDFVRVWNNQFQFMEESAIEAFPMPCCFIEVSGPSESLGLGFTAAELAVRVHIGATEYDSAQGTIGQNLSIFALRDEVKQLLTYFEATGCSGLQFVNEEQDYTHTNVYHYIMDFKCSHIDDKGDKTVGQTTGGPPTELELIVSIN